MAGRRAKPVGQGDGVPPEVRAWVEGIIRETTDQHTSTRQAAEKLVERDRVRRDRAWALGQRIGLSYASIARAAGDSGLEENVRKTLRNKKPDPLPLPPRWGEGEQQGDGQLLDDLDQLAEQLEEMRRRIAGHEEDPEDQDLGSREDEG